jgi:hypothetical protein
MKITACATLAFAAALGLATAAGSAASTDKGAPARAGRSCFWVRDVNNFSAPDNRTVYIRVGVSQVYKLTLFGNCLDVSWVHHIGLASHGVSNICEGPNPDLDVFDREIGIGHQRCPVTDVRKLTPDEVKALPKQDRP